MPAKFFCPLSNQEITSCYTECRHLRRTGCNYDARQIAQNEDLKIMRGESQWRRIKRMARR